MFNDSRFTVHCFFFFTRKRLGTGCLFKRLTLHMYMYMHALHLKARHCNCTALGSVTLTQTQTHRHSRGSEETFSVWRKEDGKRGRDVERWVKRIWMLSTSLSMDVLVLLTMKGAAKCDEIAEFRKGTRTIDESTFSNDTRTQRQMQDTSTNTIKKTHTFTQVHVCGSRRVWLPICHISSADSPSQDGEGEQCQAGQHKRGEERRGEERRGEERRGEERRGEERRGEERRGRASCVKESVFNLAAK